MRTKHFEQFIDTGLYLRGWRPKTASLYRQAFQNFQRFQLSLHEVDATGTHHQLGASCLTKAQLEAWLIWMRQNGKTPAGCNIYTCVFNAFCSWLKEQGHLQERIRVGKLKNHPKPVTVLSELEVRKLLASKPKRQTYLRTWILIVLMLDTGCRIDEALNLKAGDVDFDSLLLVVLGKGGKFRRIPFSVDLRKHLFPYAQKSTGVFCLAPGPAPESAIAMPTGTSRDASPPLA